mmetsp:Transcript_19468/g.58833  ORF Transcript_19468/g.58833 Transcript_19468/m.58833 type:complete len:84 (-) Transcript_19468:108-359(-)
MSRPEPHLRFLAAEEATGLLWLPPEKKIVLPGAVTGAAEFFCVALADASPLTALMHAVQGDRRVVEERWVPSAGFGGLERQLR